MEKETKEVNKKEENISVTPAFLEEMKRTMDSLIEKNDMLLEIADKKALAKWQARNKKDLPVEIKLRQIEVRDEKTEETENKIILGWKTTKNDVEFDPVTKRGFEDQRVELLFEDGTKKELTLLDFNRRFDYVVCKKVGEIIDDKSGEVVYKLIRVDNGKEYSIGAAYIN